MNISILGAGSMGTALAHLFAGKDHTVRIWSIIPEEVEMLNRYHEQREKLPGVILPNTVTCSGNLNEAAEGFDLWVVAVPSHALRSTGRQLAGMLDPRAAGAGPGAGPGVEPGVEPGAGLGTKAPVIACFTKGMESGTGCRMSEILQQELPGCRVVAMSGPCHAEELGREMPGAYVAASGSKMDAEYVQRLLMTPYFRIYTQTDVVGVETGGALKNIIALCAGILEGAGFGDNTKAALMTRGMAEIIRLGMAMGARRETFSGLTGYGDLVVTCTSIHSRNRRCGILIGQGMPLKEALARINMVVEGVLTTRAAEQAANRLQISMPITKQAHLVLFEGKSPREAIMDLMTREPTSEEPI